MRLYHKILKRIEKQSGSRSPRRRTNSPPPERDVIQRISQLQISKQKKTCQYEHVRRKVDASPPRYQPRALVMKTRAWCKRWRLLLADHVDLLTLIKRAHFTRGRVDSRWEAPPRPVLRWYHNRVNFLRRVQRDNKQIYQRIATQGPKVDSTAYLGREWARNRRDIIQRAQARFVLFPPLPAEQVEDPAFRRPAHVRRPRVYLTVHMAGHADVGELCCELFADVCPRTCRLFLELLAGDRAGYSYVGTHFFRKVPHLYWSGGDVVHDNGFGCYMQCGRRAPIGAENYHFSHSMPGLLSMSVTCDDEMCGIFNITFKPLPQLDLKNVVFGRVIRPSHVFNNMSELGSSSSSRPSLCIRAARRRERGRWVAGAANTRLQPAAGRLYTVHCAQ